MVSRSLTEVFVLMRNNAIHSRQLFSDQREESERTGLMHDDDADLESGLELRGHSAAPPVWIDTLEETHYIITRLRSKIDELREAHARQLSRPPLDDGEAQAAAARGAADLSRQFAHAHRNVMAVKAYAGQGTKLEQKLVGNVVLALVTTLQDLSLSFRTDQSNYLKTLTTREERSNAYLDLPNFEELSLDDSLLPANDLLFDVSTDQPHEKYNQMQQQLLLEQDNTKFLAEKEKEVNRIVKSITELNDIFKDLAHMVHDQGTILDRIDYNIESTQVQVEEGYKQLKKADMYQRKNRKMQCILILSVSVVVSVLLLIIVKS